MSYENFKTIIEGHLKFDYDSPLKNSKSIENKELDSFFPLRSDLYYIYGEFHKFIKLEAYKRQNRWTDDVFSKNLDIDVYFKYNDILKDILILEPYDEVVEFRDEREEKNLSRIVANALTDNGCKLLNVNENNLTGHFELLPNYYLKAKCRLIDPYLYL